MATPEDPDIRVIAPSRGWRGPDVSELWRYRELIVFFAWRNVLVRYKQTVIGIGWAVLQPFLMMIVLSVVFGRLAKSPSNGVAYPLFAYAGLLPWLFFANSMAQGATSLVSSSSLLSKIYFPRLALPISTVISGLLDFLIASVLLGVLMVWYGEYPRMIAIAVVPGLIVVAALSALGVGTFLSALNVAYRDVQYVLPFMTQIWFFATVIYPTSLLSEPWRTLSGLNPMAGVVEGFRWALLPTRHSPGWMVVVSTAVSCLLLVGGVVYFRRAEKTFADVI
jgi:lipopolysaccharide transport system permease protein